MDGMRTCHKCKKSKPLTEFKKRKDGNCVRCKVCNAKYNKNKKQTTREGYIDEPNDVIHDEINDEINNEINNDNEDLSNNKKTRQNKERSKKEKDKAKKAYQVLGITLCIISGVCPVQLAHLEPFATNPEKDVEENMIPLEPTHHTTFDNGLFSFDPNDSRDPNEKEKIKLKLSGKYKMYKIVISDKASPKESIRKFSGKYVPIFIRSEPYLKAHYENFQKNNYS
jgi:hypothetical protein